MISQLRVCRWLVAICFLVLAAVARAQAPATPAPGQCYAVLIGGLAGQQMYGDWYADWLARFHTYLTQTAQVPGANIIQLSGKDATFAAVTDAFTKLGQRANAQDQLIVFIVGHGEINGPAPTLALPGPDPTAPQVAALLNAFPAKSQVILNFGATSGDFLKYLSAPGRVNISATSPTEEEEPVFTEFFLRGLESKRAANGTGAITLLESFNWAAQQTAQWIVRWAQTNTDATKSSPSESSVWKASGKETVEIFKKLYAKAPTRKLDPTSDGNAADSPAVLEPPGGNITPDWANRRAVDEHALLEDCGQGIGVSVMTDKGLLQPIVGLKPGDPGYLASRTVLGQPTQL